MRATNGRDVRRHDQIVGSGERIVVITAAGAKTFTSGQLARLISASDVAFHARPHPLAPGELAMLASEATVLAITPRSVPTLGREAIEDLPRSLHGIAVFATGIDFVDLDALEEREIALAHLPDYSALSVAEHTIALLLTLSRRVHLSRDRVLGRVPATTSVRGFELFGKTIGVVGTGRIGTRVAALAEALGMRVVATDRRWPGRPTLGDVLADAHVVSLHVPGAWKGVPLLGPAEVAAMRPGAFLVNASRASLVDEQAVIRALDSGRLAGYAVDDCLRDRIAAGRLVEEGRVVETGHSAWYSQEAIDRGLETWVENVLGLATGRPRNLVTPVMETVASGRAALA